MSSRRRRHASPQVVGQIQRRLAAASLVVGGLLAIVPAAAVAAPFQGTSSMRWQPAEYPSASSLSTIVGDLDGDGRDDFAFARDTIVIIASSTSTSSGLSDRNVDEPVPAAGIARLALPPDEQISSIAAAGDFDGDGRDDMVVSTASKVYVYYGGTTSLPAYEILAGSGRYTTITGSYGQPLGDFDGNGRDDLVISRKEGGVAIVHGGPRVGSIDGNGKNARTSQFNSSTSCTLISGIIPSCTWRRASASAIGDFNGDGRDDLALDPGASGTTAKRWIVLGRTGTFTTNAGAPSTSFSMTPADVARDTRGLPSRVGDLNGDGLDDFGPYPATLGNGANGSRFILGTATPPSALNLATAPAIELAGGSSAVPVGDQTGDGRADLAVVAAQSSVYARFEGDVRLITAPTGAGLVDATGGAAVKGIPLATLLGPGIADVNGDGKTDLVAVRIDYPSEETYANPIYRYVIATDGVDKVAPRIESASIAPAQFRAVDGADIAVKAEESETILEITYANTPSGSLSATERRTVGRGANTLRFNGIVGGTKLPVGSYSATVVPVDEAGNRGPSKTFAFTLLGDPVPAGELPQGVASLKRSGDAELYDDTVISLTSGRASSRGTAVFPLKRDFNDRTIEFEAAIYDTGGGAGAGEGMTMAFITKDADAAGNWLGSGGQQLGYGGLQGFALGIDTAKGPNDPSDNFIGWSPGTMGTGMQWVQTADPAVPLVSGSWIKFKVVLAGRRAAVYVNGSLRLERAYMLPTKSRLAFTAATGAGGGQIHEIRRLKVS